jgi:DNA-directed RNA polymerase subunit E'/Rpb7
VLIAVVNVTFTLVMWTWEVSEIIEDEIPEAMKAAIVLCFR